MNRFEITKIVAEEGDPEAQFVLGDMYYYGKEVAASKATAFQWYKNSAEQGYAEAQYKLFTMYENGDGVSKSHKEALVWLKKAHNQNYNLASTIYKKTQKKLIIKAIGAFTLFIILVIISATIMFYHFKTNAQMGNADAQYKMGFFYENIKGNEEAAIAWYNKSARQGNDGSLINLKKIAEQGNAKAQFDLGKIYADGSSTAINPSMATKWISKAAKQKLPIAITKLNEMATVGNVSAQYTLGRMHTYGEGVNIDITKAIELFSKSASSYKESVDMLFEIAKQGNSYALSKIKSIAEKGDSEIQHRIATMYMYGEGVKIDITKAIELFSKSASSYKESVDMLFKIARQGNSYALSKIKIIAEKGDSEIQYRIATLYKYGDGVNVDISLAFKWYNKAAKLGNVEAQQSLKNGGFPCPGIPTVTYDGNTYNTVQIGDQCWLKENLDVAHFSNGEEIPHAGTIEEWIIAGENGEPAWCYYNNDEVNEKKYGKLYNWYAVNDPRGLAPKGWSVPTKEDLDVLIAYVNNEAVKLIDQSETMDGYTPTNETGFSALFAGYRNSYDGNFYNKGIYPHFWSSTEYSSDHAHNMYLRHNHYDVYYYSHRKNYGFSVRCLKNGTSTELENSKPNADTLTTSYDSISTNLHKSIKNHVENILYWDMEKFRVRIDKLSNGTLRYTGWKADMPYDAKPTLVLLGGEVSTNYNENTYTFKSGVYSYVVITNRGFNDGELIIYKNNQLLLTERVTKIL